MSDSATNTTNKDHVLPLGKSMIGVFKNSLGILAHFVDLVAVEARLASLSLVMIIAAAIGIVLLIMSTWLLLMLSVAFAMVTAGYTLGLTLLVVACLNTVAFIPLIYTIINLSRNLLFKFTCLQTKDLMGTEINQHATT